VCVCVWGGSDPCDAKMTRRRGGTSNQHKRRTRSTVPTQLCMQDGRSEVLLSEVCWVCPERECQRRRIGVFGVLERVTEVGMYLHLVQTRSIRITHHGGPSTVGCGCVWHNIVVFPPSLPTQNVEGVLQCNAAALLAIQRSSTDVLPPAPSLRVHQKTSRQRLITLWSGEPRRAQSKPREVG
jgi:hypothetical protein